MQGAGPSSDSARSAPPLSNDNPTSPGDLSRPLDKRGFHPAGNNGAGAARPTDGAEEDDEEEEEGMLHVTEEGQIDEDSGREPVSTRSLGSRIQPLPFPDKSLNELMSETSQQRRHPSDKAKGGPRSRAGASRHGSPRTAGGYQDRGDRFYEASPAQAGYAGGRQRFPYSGESAPLPSPTSGVPPPYAAGSHSGYGYPPPRDRDPSRSDSYAPTTRSGFGGTNPPPRTDARRGAYPSPAVAARSTDSYRPGAPPAPASSSAAARDRDRDWDWERERERDREWGVDRERDAYRYRDLERERDWERERSRAAMLHSSAAPYDALGEPAGHAGYVAPPKYGPDRLDYPPHTIGSVPLRDRDREREYEREWDYEREWERDRERERERDRDPLRDRERDREMLRDRPPGQRDQRAWATANTQPPATSGWRQWGSKSSDSGRGEAKERRVSDKDAASDAGRAASNKAQSSPTSAKDNESLSRPPPSASSGPRSERGDDRERDSSPRPVRPAQPHPQGAEGTGDDAKTVAGHPSNETHDRQRHASPTPASIAAGADKGASPSQSQPAPARKSQIDDAEPGASDSLPDDARQRPDNIISGPKTPERIVEPKRIFADDLPESKQTVGSASTPENISGAATGEQTETAQSQPQRDSSSEAVTADKQVAAQSSGDNDRPEKVADRPTEAVETVANAADANVPQTQTDEGSFAEQAQSESRSGELSTSVPSAIGVALDEDARSGSAVPPSKPDVEQEGLRSSGTEPASRSEAQSAQDADRADPAKDRSDGMEVDEFSVAQSATSTQVAKTEGAKIHIELAAVDATAASDATERAAADQNESASLDRTAAESAAAPPQAQPARDDKDADTAKRAAEPASVQAAKVEETQAEAIPPAVGPGQESTATDIDLPAATADDAPVSSVALPTSASVAEVEDIGTIKRYAREEEMEEKANAKSRPVAELSPSGPTAKAADIVAAAPPTATDSKPSVATSAVVEKEDIAAASVAQIVSATASSAGAACTAGNVSTDIAAEPPVGQAASAKAIGSPATTSGVISGTSTVAVKAEGANIAGAEMTFTEAQPPTVQADAPKQVPMDVDPVEGGTPAAPRTVAASDEDKGVDAVMGETAVGRPAPPFAQPSGHPPPIAGAAAHGSLEAEGPLKPAREAASAEPGKAIPDPEDAGLNPVNPALEERAEVEQAEAVERVQKPNRGRHPALHLHGLNDPSLPQPESPLYTPRTEEERHRASRRLALRILKEQPVSDRDYRIIVRDNQELSRKTTQDRLHAAIHGIPLVVKEEKPLWRDEDDDSFARTHAKLMSQLLARRQRLNEKVDRLKQQYRTINSEWQVHCARLDRIIERRELQRRPLISQPQTPAGTTNDEPSSGGVLGANVMMSRTNRRGQQAGFAGFGDAVRSEAEFLEILASLENADMQDPNMRAARTTATIPDMELDPDSDRPTQLDYDDENGFVADPVGFYLSDFDPDFWSDEEKAIFARRYALWPKQFGKIAQALPHKTPNQCVVYYYLNKKTEGNDFKALAAARNRERKRKARVKPKKAKGSALMADLKSAKGDELDDDDAGAPSPPDGNDAAKSDPPAAHAPPPPSRRGGARPKGTANPIEAQSGSVGEDGPAATIISAGKKRSAADDAPEADQEQRPSEKKRSAPKSKRAKTESGSGDKAKKGKGGAKRENAGETQAKASATPAESTPAVQPSPAAAAVKEDPSLNAATTPASTAAAVTDSQPAVSHADSDLAAAEALGALAGMFGAPAPSTTDPTPVQQHSDASVAEAKTAAPDASTSPGDADAQKTTKKRKSGKTAGGEGAEGGEPAIGKTKTRQPTSSYWSVAERSEFLRSLALHGKNWDAIAAALSQKSAAQARNYFARNAAEPDFAEAAALAEQNAGLPEEERVQAASAFARQRFAGAAAAAAAHHVSAPQVTASAATSGPAPAAAFTRGPSPMGTGSHLTPVTAPEVNRSSYFATVAGVPRAASAAPVGPAPGPRVVSEGSVPESAAPDSPPATIRRGLQINSLLNEESAVDQNRKRRSSIHDWFGERVDVDAGREGGLVRHRSDGVDRATLPPLAYGDTERRPLTAESPPSRPPGSASGTMTASTVKRYEAFGVQRQPSSTPSYTTGMPPPSAFDKSAGGYPHRYASQPSSTGSIAGAHQQHRPLPPSLPASGGPDPYSSSTPPGPASRYSAQPEYRSSTPGLAHRSGGISPVEAPEHTLPPVHSASSDRHPTPDPTPVYERASSAAPSYPNIPPYGRYSASPGPAAIYGNAAPSSLASMRARPLPGSAYVSPAGGHGAADRSPEDHRWTHRTLESPSGATPSSVSSSTPPAGTSGSPHGYGSYASGAGPYTAGSAYRTMTNPYSSYGAQGGARARPSLSPSAGGGSAPLPPTLPSLSAGGRSLPPLLGSYGGRPLPPSSVVRPSQPMTPDEQRWHQHHHHPHHHHHGQQGSQQQREHHQDQ